MRIAFANTLQDALKYSVSVVMSENLRNELPRHNARWEPCSHSFLILYAQFF